MDMHLVLTQAKAQIDKEFPVKPKFEMTTLHKNTVALIRTSSRPMRFRSLAIILCGDDPYAAGWTDRALELADALNDLHTAKVLHCSSIGWTKP